MLKVAFVDDEYLVRNLLKNCLKWGELGIEIVGEAGSAQEALELVERVVPDILFIDINIPIMNGIQLSRAISEKYPHIRIIILTGYQEFEYAQSSIKIGVADFLTKPIIADEIRESVIRVKAKIERERSQRNEVELLKKQVEEIVLESKDDLFDEEETDIVKAVQDYLRENMADFELSLQKVAGVFYINQSYLSRIFKQRTGINFVEYLTDIRVQKAIELLKKTDLKVYRIAEKVGIIDPHYLGVCFKKLTGMSMSEYKKSLGA